MHDTESKIRDPYEWVRTMNEEERQYFKREEEEFAQLSLFKNDLLNKQILREQEFYEHVPQALPVKIGDFIYYRRFDNPADSMTLYRFPVEELSKRGFKESDIPYLKEEGYSFPEEEVFSLRDLSQLYKDFAMRDEQIKFFIEKITEYATT